MIRVVMFDLGDTLVDTRQRRPFPHVREALTALKDFHSGGDAPLQSWLVSDFKSAPPPLTPEKSARCSHCSSRRRAPPNSISTSDRRRRR